MEMLEIEIVEVELKYCERCGGLWLRPVGSERVYCGTCAPKMADLPGKRPNRVRLPNGDGGDFEATIEDLAALCSEGGNA